MVGKHVLDRGIRHVYIKRVTPRLNGKVERSHRIDDEQFYRMLAGAVIDDAKLFNAKLQEWSASTISSGPCGLGGQTPYERIRQLTRPVGVTGLRQLNTKLAPGQGLEP